VEQRVGRGGAEILEVVPGADARDVVGQGDPVPLSRRPPEYDLEAAVGRDVVPGIVDDPGDPPRITARLAAGVE
jgi:hypothetical protein